MTVSRQILANALLCALFISTVAFFIPGSDALGMAQKEAAGEVGFESEPAGAEVFINGQRAGVTPYPDRESTGRIRYVEIQVVDRGHPATARIIAKVGRDGKEMVWIPGGTFIMGDRWGDGDSDERPAHVETVEGFWMDQTEITNGEFQKFVEATNYQPRGSWSRSWTYGPGRTDYPADFITWDDAQAYARWAGKRLPTEKEWEYAAGGPSHTKWSLGDMFDETRYSFKRFPNEMAARGPEPVKSYPPNGWGLYDMGGSVSEWTADYYYRYPGNPDNNRFYGEEYRIVRGGSWWTMDESQLRVSDRNWLKPSQDDGRGFRCVE